MGRIEGARRQRGSHCCARLYAGGTIDMLEKDLGYARALATESRVPIPMTAAAHEVYVAVRGCREGPLCAAIIELWRERGGDA